MKVLIVEDEGVAARRLTKLLETMGIDVISHCKSNKQLRDYIDNKPEPDLYFFDIHLNDGHIFEIIEDADINAPIIFTTAYQEYAIKAFKQNSIDYLLKPIDEGELKAAIEKFKKHHQTKSTDLKSLAKVLLGEKSNYRDRILIKAGTRLKSIVIEDISLFYSENKSSYLLTNEGRSYPLDMSIEQMSKEISPKLFFRVNRGEIINIKHIEDIIVYSNSRLKIILKSTDKEIICARERVKEFKEWLG